MAGGRRTTELHFVLSRIKGMQQKAVARRLDVPVSVVEEHLIRAIAHLSLRLAS